MTHETELLLSRILDRLDRIEQKLGNGQRDYLTVDDLCARYRVSRWSVYGWCREGRIEYVQHGRKRLFSAQAVREMDERHTDRSIVNIARRIR